MVQSLHVVILAAGEGKRMKSKTPKVLQLVGGKPMLAHVIQTANLLKPQQIHVVYGHCGNEVRTRFADQKELHWVRQLQQLGTGHALKQAVKDIPDSVRVLVLYGDVPLVQVDTLQSLLAVQSDLVVLAARLEDPAGYGRIKITKDGKVAEVIEQVEANANQQTIELVNTGIIVGRSDALRHWLSLLSNTNAKGEYYLTEMFAMAHAESRAAEIVEVARPEEEVAGANDLWQLAQLERLWQMRQARILTLKGVHLMDPARFDLRGQVHAGTDVLIDVDVVLEGDIELGDGVRIGPFVKLKDVRLGAGTHIYAHCDLEGVMTEQDVQIGPFARLRPGTKLAREAHIGNFVETKQTTIGLKSKVNHLSYLGDAQLGSRVNVGAGTITCNFDGSMKHLTVIGDQAFVGSNTSLVAPISVGEKATIGAGTVLTQSAPSGELTLARAAQTTIQGWRRPDSNEPPDDASNSN